MIVKTYTDPSHIPGVFGIKPVIVLSGSMSPAFESKSLIFIKETDSAELKKGDIICYITGKTAVTHRIDEIKTENGELKFIMKGDANNVTDKLAVSPNQIEGKYIGHIPKLGGFAIFMQSTTGMLLFIVLPVILYLLWDIVTRSKESRKEKNRTKELESQLEKLKKEKDDK